MNSIEFFLQSIKLGLHHNVDWFVNCFSLPMSKIDENKYFKMSNGKYISLINGKEEVITDKSFPDSLLDNTDKFKIKKGEFVNVDKDYDTDIGKALINTLLFAENFGTIINYINVPFSIKDDIENNIIATKLVDDDKVIEGKNVSIKMRTDFNTAVTYLRSISDMFVTAISDKLITPAPGIFEYRDKLIKEYKDKHGKDVFTDPAMVSDLNDKLKAFDMEYLKGDPTLLALYTGKVKTAREKMFITVGGVSGFSTDNKVKHVVKSYSEGWPLDDPEALTAMNNDTREGSYKRGFETRNGGYFAKIVLRALGAVSITIKDCGTKLFKEYVIDKSNLRSRVGNYHFLNGKSVSLTLDYLNNNIGKVIKLRATSFCNEDSPNYCELCSGDTLSKKKEGLALVGTEITSNILNTSMSAMHAKALVTERLSIDDMF